MNQMISVYTPTPTNNPPIEETMDRMAYMVAKFLFWLAPEGQYQLRIRLLIHFLKRVKHYVNNAS